MCGGGEQLAWYHPSHQCIADTLKLIWKRVESSRRVSRAAGGVPISGAVLLPEWPDAAWQRLAVGLRRVKVWPAGAPVLEEWRGGTRGWASVCTASPVGLYLFPAAADRRLRPMQRGGYAAAPCDVVVCTPKVETAAAAAAIGHIDSTVWRIREAPVTERTKCY